MVWIILGAAALVGSALSFKLARVFGALASQVLWAGVMAEMTLLELLIDLEEYGSFQKPLLLHSELTDFSSPDTTVSVDAFDPRFTASARFALSKWYLPRHWRAPLMELYVTTSDLHEYGQKAPAADVYGSAMAGLQLSKSVQRLFKKRSVERAKTRAETLPAHGMLKMSLKHFASQPAISTSQIGHC